MRDIKISDVDAQSSETLHDSVLTQGLSINTFYRSKIKKYFRHRGTYPLQKTNSVITIQVTVVNISTNDGFFPIKLYSYPLWFAFHILLHIFCLAFPLHHIINKISSSPRSSSTSRKPCLAFCSSWLRPCTRSAQRGIELRRPSSSTTRLVKDAWRKWYLRRKLVDGLAKKGRTFKTWLISKIKESSQRRRSVAWVNWEGQPTSMPLWNAAFPWPWEVSKSSFVSTEKGSWIGRLRGKKHSNDGKQRSLLPNSLPHTTERLWTRP